MASKDSGLPPPVPDPPEDQKIEDDSGARRPSTADRRKLFEEISTARESALPSFSEEDLSRMTESKKRRLLRQKMVIARMQMSVLNARLGLQRSHSGSTSPVGRELAQISEEIGASESLVADVSSAIAASLTSKSPTHDSDSVALSKHSRDTSELSFGITGVDALTTELTRAIERIESLELKLDQSSATARVIKTERLPMSSSSVESGSAEKRKSFVDYSLQAAGDSNMFLLKERDELRKTVQELEQTIAAMKEKTKLMEMQISSAKRASVVMQKTAALGAPGSAADAASLKRTVGTSAIAAQLTQRIGAGSKGKAEAIDWLKYRTLEKMGMNAKMIEGKLKGDGVSDADIEKFKRKDPSTMAGTGAAKDKYAKYERMKKMGMPEVAIVNSMKMDGLSAEDIEQWKNPSLDKDPKYAKYVRMRDKMKLPPSAIESRMRLDGFSKDDIDAFLRPKPKGGSGGGGKGQTLEELKKDEKYAKFFRMKGMGLPNHVITNKMRFEGIDKNVIEVFEGKIPHTKFHEAAAGGEPTLQDLEKDEAFAKYFRCKKLGMPMHVITNKMKQDGVAKNMIEVFEGKKPAAAAAGGGEVLDKVALEAQKLGLKPKARVKPSKPMKRFHWQTVDMARVKKSGYWQSIDDTSIKFDFGAFESAFAVPEKPKKGILGGLFGKKKAEEKKDPDEVKFIDAKRQYGCELLLKRLKLDGDKLRNDIITMNEKVINAELMQKVLELVPTEAERLLTLSKLTEYHFGRGKKDKTGLFGVVESFFVKLAPVPRIKDRIGVWMEKILFAESVTDKQERILTLLNGLEAIQKSKAMKEFLAIVLAFGNYLNGSKANGQAYGFRLETLRMLSGMKTADGKMSLLMYVCKYANPPEPTPLKLLTKEERKERIVEEKRKAKVERRRKKREAKAKRREQRRMRGSVAEDSSDDDDYEMDLSGSKKDAGGGSIGVGDAKKKKVLKPKGAPVIPPLTVRIGMELESVTAAASTDLVVLEKQIVEMQQWVEKLPEIVRFFGLPASKKKKPGGKVNADDVFAERMQVFYNVAAETMVSLKEQLTNTYDLGQQLCDNFCFEADGSDAADGSSKKKKGGPSPKALATAALLTIFKDFLKDFKKESSKWTMLKIKKAKEHKKKLAEIAKREKLTKHVKRMTMMNNMFADDLAVHSSDEDSESSYFSDTSESEEESDVGSPRVPPPGPLPFQVGKAPARRSATEQKRQAPVEVPSTGLPPPVPSVPLQQIAAGRQLPFDDGSQVTADAEAVKPGTHLALGAKEEPKKKRKSFLQRLKWSKRASIDETPVAAEPIAKRTTAKKTTATSATKKKATVTSVASVTRLAQGDAGAGDSEPRRVQFGGGDSEHRGAGVADSMLLGDIAQKATHRGADSDTGLPFGGGDDSAIALPFEDFKSPSPRSAGSTKKKTKKKATGSSKKKKKTGKGTKAKGKKKKKVPRADGKPKGHVRRETRIKMIYGTMGAAQSSYKDIHSRAYSHRPQKQKSRKMGDLTKGKRVRTKHRKVVSPLGSSMKTAQVVKQQTLRREAEEEMKSAVSAMDPGTLERYRQISTTGGRSLDKADDECISAEVFDF